MVIEGEDELARLANSFNNMVREIDERERHIAHLAFNDVLTGLPNRSMFQKQAEQFLSMRRGPAAMGWRCSASISTTSSRSTTRSDTLQATPVLVAVASRLKQAATGCFVSRLGGDEFVIAQLGSRRARGNATGWRRAVISRDPGAAGHRRP